MNGLFNVPVSTGRSRTDYLTSLCLQDGHELVTHQDIGALEATRAHNCCRNAKEWEGRRTRVSIESMEEKAAYIQRLVASWQGCLAEHESRL